MGRPVLSKAGKEDGAVGDGGLSLLQWLSVLQSSETSFVRTLDSPIKEKLPLT